MNGMGGNNKLQAMMAGLLGTGQQQGGPPAQGPSPNQPTGLQQPNDPAYSGFVKVKQGMMGLSQMLETLGDSISANQVQELAVELMKIGESRSQDMLKKIELDQKLNSAQQMINPNAGPQGGGY